MQQVYEPVAGAVPSCPHVDGPTAPSSNARSGSPSVSTESCTMRNMALTVAASPLDARQNALKAL